MINLTENMQGMKQLRVKGAITSTKMEKQHKMIFTDKMKRLPRPERVGGGGETASCGVNGERWRGVVELEALMVEAE